MPELPQVQKVEQNKPVDLSGQSKKVLEIKSHIASVKSPIAKSGVFTKMLESLTQMEKHLQKLRDFGAAKTDVKWNEKTGQYHATLDSNKMVPFSDARVPEGATRAEPKLDTFEAMGKEGSGEMLDELKQINENTRGLITSGKSNAEDAMEEEAYKENQDREQAKRDKERSMTLGGMWDSIKEGNKDSWLVKNWKKIVAGLILLFAPLKALFKIAKILGKVLKWGLGNPKSALVLGLGAYFGGKALLKFAGGWASKGAGLALDKVKGGIGKFFENRKALSMMKDQGLKPRGGPGLLSRTGGAIKTGAMKAGGAIKTGAMKAGGAIKTGASKAGGAIKSVAKTGGGWFKTLMGKFGQAGKFLVKIGKSVIQGLMTMGPYGWAIIGGIALGGLVWYFWDDITKVWNDIAGKISEGFTKIKEMVSGLAGSAQTMLGDFLRGMGAGMIADWIDPKGADPENKKEFTWGGFVDELWTIYSGIWGKIIDFVKSINPIEIIKNVGEMIGGAAKTIWNSVFGGDDEPVNTIGSANEGSVVLTEEQKEMGRNAPGIQEKAKTEWSSFEKTDEGKEYLKTFKDPKTGKVGGKSSGVRKRARKAWEAQVASGGDTASVTENTASIISKQPRTNFKTPNYGGSITATSDRGLKRQGDLAAKKIKEDVLSGKLPYADARMELEKLAMPDKNFVDTKMRLIDRQAGQRGIIPNVSPSDKTAALGTIHNENATLKGEQGGGGSFVNNSPTNVTTNNSPTTLVLPGTNNAQGGMKIGQLIE